MGLGGEVVSIECAGRMGPALLGIAYRCDSTRHSVEVVEEVVDRSQHSCQAQ